MFNQIYSTVLYFSYIYMNFMIVPIGILTNMVSIIIFIKKRLNKKTNIGYMHALLCLFNIFPLINSVMLTQILPHYKIDLFQKSEFSCKLFSFWIRFALDCPSFQQIYITAMLMVSIKFPIKFISFQKFKYTILVLLVMLIGSFGLNIPFLFFENSLNSINNSSFEMNNSFYMKIETFECNANKVLSTVSDMLNLLMRYYIPFMVLLVTNGLIVKHFIDQRKRLKFKKWNKGTKNFLISITIINTLFLILYLPSSISFLLIYTQFIEISSESLSYSMVDFFNLGLTISYLNNTVPFFAHLAFNRIFRNELIKSVQKLFGFKHIKL